MQGRTFSRIVYWRKPGLTIQQSQQTRTTDMPADHVIANVSDGTTREAFLAIRSEFYSELNKLELLITNLAQQNSTQIAVTAEERRAREQWRSSINRLLTKHIEEDDERFSMMVDKKTFDDRSAKIDRQFSAANKWVLSIMTSIIGGLLVAVVVLAGKITHAW